MHSPASRSSSATDGSCNKPGAVNVRTGNFVYFDTSRDTIRPEHIMASGALPRGFAVVEIEGERDRIGRARRVERMSVSSRNARLVRRTSRPSNEGQQVQASFLASMEAFWVLMLISLAAVRSRLSCAR